MSTQTVSTEEPGVIGAAWTGLAMIARRPWLPLAWALVGLPMAVLVVAMARMLLGTQNLLWGVGALAAIVGTRFVQAVQQAAGYRAVLRPEDRGWAHLGIGSPEFRIAFLGFGRNPGGWPIWLFFGIGLGVVLGVGGIVFASKALGPPAGLAVAFLGFVAIATTITAANVRAVLASVAAFIGKVNPQDDGWERGEGHTLALVIQAFIVNALWLVGTIVLFGVWAAATSALIQPTMLWATSLPADPAGWMRLGAEILAYATVFSLAGALGVALSAPVAARTWRLLGGTDEAVRRRALFGAEA